MTRPPMTFKHRYDVKREGPPGGPTTEEWRIFGDCGYDGPGERRPGELLPACPLCDYFPDPMPKCAYLGRVTQEVTFRVPGDPWPPADREDYLKRRDRLRDSEIPDCRHSKRKAAAWSNAPGAPFDWYCPDCRVFVSRCGGVWFA